MTRPARPTPHRADLRVAVRSWLLGASIAALGLPSAVLAQAFPIVPPRLPPRAAAHAGQAPQAPQAPGAAAGQAARAQAPVPQSYAPQAYPSTGPAPMPAVTTAAAPPGRCRVQPSPERASLALVSGEPPLAREHVPLGEFRAQQVIHSQDGRWAVAFTKLRGAPQFAALSFDLEGCRVQRSIELPAAGSDALFEGDQALLRFAGGERRVPLNDGSVR
jgi:hypothetical protein